MCVSRSATGLHKNERYVKVRLKEIKHGKIGRRMAKMKYENCSENVYVDRTATDDSYLSATPHCEDSYTRDSRAFYYDAFATAIEKSTPDDTCGARSEICRKKKYKFVQDCKIFFKQLTFSLLLRIFVSLYMYLLSNMCLNFRLFISRLYFTSVPVTVWGRTKKCSRNSRDRRYNSDLSAISRKLLLVSSFAALFCVIEAYPGDADKSEPFPEKVVMEEQNIAAVFNKVAYGSTTKRSIPDTAYPVTTLATPLLTTYRYSDGGEEWLRVDVKKPETRESPRSSVSFEEDGDARGAYSYDSEAYGSDLEKDHTLPTSAPAADILKNNNNKNYNNPNRYNNDRARLDFGYAGDREHVTENVHKTTTSYNVLKNVRPTKSMYSKDVPSYVPPSRSFFTPPLPPEYLNPFADKPTLRGTNSDTFANRRPIPPPSLMPSKDRIPFRPDLPPSKVVNQEKMPEKASVPEIGTSRDESHLDTKKKTLNTPSQNVNLDRLGEFYGLNRQNETNFEYEKGYIPSITRILSGSNGRHDDIPDVLLRTVTATSNIQNLPEPKAPKSGPPPRIVEDDFKQEPEGPIESVEQDEERRPEEKSYDDEEPGGPGDRSESVTIERDPVPNEKVQKVDATTPNSDIVNLPNVKEKQTNVTAKVNTDEIWLICWNVHVYLVVFIYVLLAIFSIYKLIRYENDPHMFSKSYFLTIHLMLTVICVLRIFYFTYDPYNVGRSFNVFLYDFLHNFPLSLLATTFAVLILFLLKRTLTHLKVKTRPVFLVFFGVVHILLCLCLSVSETLGHFERAGLIVCRPVFVLLAWALGFSYLYLYRIIKNVLAKKSQNLSEMCSQNISYASHITIAVALLFVLLGFVQLYALFFIKVDRFGPEIRHHWILWGFELSVRVLEISIIALLAAVVSLKMSQREKQTVGFPLFPCATSDSSTDNIYPNNCNTNPNALNYSRNEMILDNVPTEAVERPNLLKSAFQNDSFDKKSTLERPYDGGAAFDRFERPKWGSDRFDSNRVDRSSLNSFAQPNSGHFERGALNSSRNSAKKAYDGAKYYAKPKYDVDYGGGGGGDEYQRDGFGGKHAHESEHNVYSEPVDNDQYERTRHEFERSDFDRRSRNSSDTSGRRSTGRARKNHARPHLGVQTLPSHDGRHQISDSMLVDEQGFVRFRHLQDAEQQQERPKKNKKLTEMNHYSDA